MPEEQENQIERREPGGNIGRRSDIARRGMNAANYVRGLAAKPGTEREAAAKIRGYSFEFLRKWGSEGQADGQFSWPHGLAIDGDGNVYVADTSNLRIQVFDPHGRFLRKWGRRGEGDGQFSWPEGLTIDGDGNVYVADKANDRIQVFDPQGLFLRKWGSEGQADGQFSGPEGLAIDGDGNVYVADTANHRIQVFDPHGRFLRKWGSPGERGVLSEPEGLVIDGDGELGGPMGLAIGGDGNVYVADRHNGRVQVFDPHGRFLRKWGVPGFRRDGEFMSMAGLAIDGDGNVYVADQYLEQIQMFDPQGGFLGKLGTPRGGPRGGDSQFSFAFDLAIGYDGNVYVADTANHRIQVFERVLLDN